MKKWFKFARFEKSEWMQSVALVLFDKVSFYAGRTDRWGISVAYCHYDRSLTFEILNLYFGFEVWYSDTDEL